MFNNAYFGLSKDVDGERTTLAPDDSEAVDAVANLLGLPPETARRVLLERQINVRGNVTDIPLRLHEVPYFYFVVSSSYQNRTCE